MARENISLGLGVLPPQNCFVTNEPRFRGSNNAVENQQKRCGLSHHAKPCDQLDDLTFPYAFDKDVDRTASVEFCLSLLLRLCNPEDCMSPLIIFEFF